MTTDAPLRSALLAELWRRGSIAEVLLDSNQLATREVILATDASRFILEWARRLGKTWLLVVLAIEECLRGPRRRVPYGASTIKALQEFIQPTFESIIQDAPDDVRPRYSHESGHWTFPHNGSYTHLFGCDDKRKADRGRGPPAHLAILDEAGFIPILGYVVKAVLRPQLLTTGGRLIIGSSPAEEADHDFTAMCERAEANGHLSRRLIYDNPRLTQERIEEFIAEDARDEGMTVEEYKQTPTFRREYLAQRVTDKTLTAMGDDWEAMREASMVELQRPPHFDAYSSFDAGGADPHAIVFGYVDFLQGWLVIEDELLFRDGENTAQVAEAWKAKERQLWHVERFDGAVRGAIEHQQASRGTVWEGAPEQPYLRIGDNQLTMLQDLQQLHGLAVIPIGAKDEKQWMVNNLRVFTRQGRLKVHPRCTNLDRHLRTTLWKNEARADFRRKNGEHGDLLDALVYLLRMANFSRNPYPLGWNVGPGEYLPLAARRREVSSAENVSRVLYSGGALTRKLRGGSS